MKPKPSSPQGPPLWQADVFIPIEYLDPVMERLEAEALSVSWQLCNHDENVHIQGFYGTTFIKEPLMCQLELFRKAWKLPEMIYSIHPVADVNWPEVYASLAPGHQLGSFYVYGSHLKDHPVTPGTIPLWIDAATAFGSGEHATTRGCLEALEKLAKTLLDPPLRILDLGCGTGILGIAAAKLWTQATVVMSDIDPEAIRVAEINAQRNAVAPHFVTADGFLHPTIQAHAPYHSILANILAEPLCTLAQACRQAIAPCGQIVLSGLLRTQAPRVESCYQEQGFLTKSFYHLEEWTTIVMSQPERA